MIINDSAGRSRRNQIHNHRDLIVWQRGVELAVETYKLVDTLPTSERFVLGQQMLRAAISIPSNVAEGFGQFSKGAYVRHLGISRGSLNELDTQFEIGKRVNYFDEVALKKALALEDEVGRMLWALMEKLGTRRWQ